MSAQPSSSIVTPDFVRARMRHYFAVSIEEMRKAGPDISTDESQFNPTATVILADGTEANIPIGHKGNSDKQKKVGALSWACKLVDAAALIVRMAASTPRVDRIAEEIHLRMPDELTTTRQQRDYFEEKMFEFVKRKTGGSRFGMLPREYIRDMITVSAIGPLLPDMGIFAEYKWEHGQLVVGELLGDNDGIQAEFSMVPKWWN